MKLPLLLLLGLPLAALAEEKVPPGIECGHMQETSLKIFVRGNPDLHDHLATLCGSPLCYEALFSYLPDQLLERIWTALRANAFLLGQMLYYGEFYFRDTSFIPDAYKWFRSKADVGAKVCWPEKIDPDWFRYHKSSLGAISNLLIDPGSFANVIPRRFHDLPHGSLRINETLCFNRTDIQYGWLHKQARWIVTEKSITSDEKHWSYEQFLYDFSRWPGTVGLALLGMMRKEYTCGPKMQCEPDLMQGQPYLPDSHFTFLEQLKVALASERTICFALNNVLKEDRELHGVYYFIPGITADEGREFE
ncbi:hypothetical protein CDD83_653 [Cordyceps sp. RAO-2017]|nr:hypothetical protein CDD83_653 [Cordyceps sp. RAO-2017]